MLGQVMSAFEVAANLFSNDYESKFGIDGQKLKIVFPDAFHHKTADPVLQNSHSIYLFDFSFNDFTFIYLIFLRGRPVPQSFGQRKFVHPLNSQRAWYALEYSIGSR